MGKGSTGAGLMAAGIRDPVTGDIAHKGRFALVFAGMLICWLH